MLFKINVLQDYRYSVTKPHNDVQYSIFTGQGLPPDMSTTYQTLIEEHQKRLKSTSNSASIDQVVKNHQSALRGFLRTLDKTESSPVGEELGTDFEACQRRHIAESKLGKRAVSDRRSLLNAWKLTFDLLGANPAIPKASRERRFAKDWPSAKQNPFEMALRAGLQKARLTSKSAARRAGVSPSALGRWTRGALPNTRSTESLTKIEKSLNLAVGSMAAALDQANARVTASAMDHSRILRGGRSQSRYRLAVDQVTPALLDEWQEYLRYKTVTKPSGLKRGARARWSLVEPKDSSTIPNQTNSIGGKVSATADKSWQCISAFLGFLILPSALGGYGLPPHAKIGLAWLAVPEAVEAYLEFYTTRSGGMKHGGQQMFCVEVIKVTREKTGYLWQRPEFSNHLQAISFKGRDWTQMCAEAHELAQIWKAESTEISRKPADALKYFFGQDYALAPIFEIMKKLRAEAESAPAHSKTEAVARRDELILGLLVSNPLRSKNLKTMTYWANNSGEMYRDASNAWRIRIPGKKFKNKRRVSEQIYDVPVAKWLSNMITDYVKDFRPNLVNGGADNGFLFLSSVGGKRFDSISQRVFVITKRYLPECGGISIHAFRHLVATDWLTKYPNDFLTVAELLNDTIGVVIKSYAHLKKETSFTRYEEHVQSMLSPV